MLHDRHLDRRWVDKHEERAASGKTMTIPSLPRSGVEETVGQSIRKVWCIVFCVFRLAIEWYLLGYVIAGRRPFAFKVAN